MTADQLRKSILQQAIQGKLVPQDPNDEPASTLLERIREEKARLVKEKKIKKEKNPSVIFRGEDNSHYEKFILTGEVKCIDDEIPFELPNGWEWCRLGTIFQTSSGTTPQSNNPLYYKDGDINWIRTTDLNNGILRNAEVKITEQACVDYKLKEVPINAVCIAMYGGAGTIGKHALIQFRTTINQSVCAIHPNIDCSSKFLHIFIQHQRPYWMDFAAGSRKDPNINQLIIQHCLFPLPPLAEQQRIVAKIEELMPLVEQYHKAQSELNKLNTNIREQLKKSILQYAIEGKLVPQCEEDGTAEDLLQEVQAEKQRLYAEGKLKKKDLTHSTIFRGEDNKYYEKTILTGEVKCIDDEIPFELPNGWEWCRLGEVALVTGGYAFSSESLKSPQGIRVIRISDFNEQGWVNKSIVRYDGEDIASQYEIHINDLLLAMTGGTVGKSFFVQEVPEKMYLNQRVAIIRSTSLLPEYINVHLKSLFIIDLINSIKNSTNDNISMRDITSFTFPLPPLAEQQRIVDKIKLLFDRLK